MKTIELSRVKNLLMGSEGRRVDRLNAAQWGPPANLRNADSRRAVGQVLKPLLQDRDAVGRFAAIAARDEAKLAAALKKSRSAAIKGSRTAQRVLRAEAAQRVKSWELVASFPPATGTPEFELLNKPFLIWPTNSVDLEDSQVIPSNSFGKFRVKTESDFYGDVKFYYLWSNPRDKAAVINVDGYVIFNGHAFVGSGGGNFPGDRHASVTIQGRLDIFEWFNQPPTQPPQQPDQAVTALNLSVNTDGFFEVGAIDSRNLFRGYDLRHTLMVVPPFGTLVFTVTAAVTCSCGDDSSNAEVDFASGAFQIGSPAVLVAIVS